MPLSAFKAIAPFAASITLPPPSATTTFTVGIFPPKSIILDIFGFGITSAKIARGLVANFEILTASRFSQPELVMSTQGLLFIQASTAWVYFCPSITDVGHRKDLVKTIQGPLR